MAEAIGKAINVSLRVIADLSQGLYRSPADALKELVSNSYDADSPKVEINFSKDFSTCTIRDWGNGMTTEKFVEIMETIGGSSKRAADTNQKDTTKSGRKIVGRIGIGLLSVSQIANELEVQSTSAGTNKGFRATIKFDQFASEHARKIKITDLHEGNKEIKIGIYYVSEFSDVDKSKHFTILKLSGIKRVIREKLIAEVETTDEGCYPRMMGVKLFSNEELVKWMRENYITKTALHEYDRIFWELSVLCPVKYVNRPLEITDKIDRSSTSVELHNLVKEINEETHFQLFFDELECIKPIIHLDKYERYYDRFANLLFMKGLNHQTIKYFDYDADDKPKEKKLNVRGYIYYQRPNIWPPELRGLLIRVRNVAVGQYDSTFLSYRYHQAIKFAQMTGEIFVDNLDEALNIDRSSFRETDPAFVAFRDAIHNYLQKVVFPGIQEYSANYRSDRLEKIASIEEEVLSDNFNDLDLDNRKFSFGHNQDKLIERTSNKIKIARSINGKKLNFNVEFNRIIAFLEAKLKRKLTDEQRDSLYSDLIEWLEEINYDFKERK